MTKVLSKNNRITPKDRNALKGGIRRAFARSELHRKVLDAAVVDHADLARPRVKTWCYCNYCGELEARSYMVVDHVDPIIPLNSSFEELGADVTIDRTWCEEHNLQVLCKTCHNIKYKIEAKKRKEFKNVKSNKKR